jgi:hypothetical protein
MKRYSQITILIVCITLFAAMTIQAQQQWKKKKPGPTQSLQPAPQKGDYVTMVILNKQAGDTSNPNEIMYSLTVQFTNNTQKSFQVTNNDLFLTEESGRKYAVNRLRFAEALFLEPGKTVTCDRIYFTVPRDSKIQYLVLYKRGIVGGKAVF